MTRINHKAHGLAAVLLLIFSPMGFSQEVPSAERETSWDLTQLLGMNPPQVHEIQGPPAEVYTLQVEESLWQPVFYYPTQVYVFFHQNRIWQIRLDRRYAGSFMGLTMNLPRASVLEIMGPPKAEQGGVLLYDLPYRNYPRRLRLVFVEEKLSDIFIYRSDF